MQFEKSKTKSKGRHYKRPVVCTGGVATLGEPSTAVTPLTRSLTAEYNLSVSAGHKATVYLDWLPLATALLSRMHWLFDLTGLFVGWDVKGLLVFLLIFILTADYVKNRRSSSFPPGPRAIPIVGNMFTLDHSRTHETMTQVDPNQPLFWLARIPPSPVASLPSWQRRTETCTVCEWARHGWWCSTVLKSWEKLW